MPRQYNTDIERLARIETLLDSMSETMKSLENALFKHIDDSKIREQDLDLRIDELTQAEGRNMVAFKKRLKEQAIFIILGAVMSFLGMVFMKSAGLG